MAGGGQDRRFLFKYAELEACFHYRYLDVERSGTGAPLEAGDSGRLYQAGTHRAVDDIRESVAGWLTTASIC